MTVDTTGVVERLTEAVDRLERAYFSHYERMLREHEADGPTTLGFHPHPDLALDANGRPFFGDMLAAIVNARVALLNAQESNS